MAAIDLRERLRLVQGARTSRAAPPPAAPSPADLSGLGLAPVQTEAGTALCCEQRFDLGAAVGRQPLGAALQVPPPVWQALDAAGRTPPFAARRAVFVDIETTGLHGGLGTTVFLVGLGFFTSDHLVVRQYFLADHPGEPALLAALDRDTAGAAALFTFNGKRFDLQLLAARYTYHRRPFTLARLPHVDLLYPARRLWRTRLASCSLGSLEEHILAAPRQDDVPGRLAPALYFQYLQTGAADPLAGIFRHNRLDIVSLVALAGHIGRLCALPWQPAAVAASAAAAGAGPADLDALARLYLALRQPELAARCLEAALAAAPAPPARLAALAGVYKRLGRHRDAAALYEEALTQGAGLSLRPYVELAKYYEHRVRDLARARAYTRAALALLDRSPLRRTAAAAAGGGAQAALRHRLARLTRRLAAHR